MKALVVYDSIYGNTEKIAESIGKGLVEDTKVIKAGDAGPSDLDSVGLLIAGSP